MKLRLKIVSLDCIMPTLLVFAIMMFLPIIFNIDFLNPISSTIQDFYITDIVFSKIRDKSEISKDTNIVLVNIGRLNRKGIANQIIRINKFEPKLLGIDSFFRNPKDEDTDSLLSQAFRNTKRLVLVSQLKSYDDRRDKWDSLVKSFYVFNENAKTGYANVSINEDNVKTARIFSVSQTTVQGIEKSFPIQIISMLYPDKYKKLLDRDNEEEIINFKRNLDKYTVIDADELFNDAKDFSFIKNKIVLMGYLGDDTSKVQMEDRYFSPMNEKFIGKSIPDIYGMLIHANVISQIINDDYIDSLPNDYMICLVALLVYLNMLFFKYLETKKEYLFEPLSLITILLEMFLLMIFIIMIFQLFNYSIVMTEAFLAIGLTATAYETYNSSIKSIYTSVIGKFKKRNNEKDI